MTPTEQDKELREAVSELGYMCPADSSDVRHVMQLITADRKRVALEAEINAWKQVRKSYPKKQTLQGRAISRLTLADVDRKITELKAQLQLHGSRKALR